MYDSRFLFMFIFSFLRNILYFLNFLSLRLLQKPAFLSFHHPRQMFARHLFNSKIVIHISIVIIISFQYQYFAKFNNIPIFQYFM